MSLLSRIKGPRNKRASEGSNAPGNKSMVDLATESRNVDLGGNDAMRPLREDLLVEGEFAFRQHKRK